MANKNLYVMHWTMYYHDDTMSIIAYSAVYEKFEDALSKMKNLVDEFAHDFLDPDQGWTETYDDADMYMIHVIGYGRNHTKNLEITIEQSELES